MKGILKNFTNVFRRYRNPLLPLFWRFEFPDKVTTFREVAFHKSMEKLGLKEFGLFAISVGIVPLLNATKSDLIQFIANFTLDTSSDEGIEWLKSRLLRFHKRKITAVEYKDRRSVQITFKGKKVVVKRLKNVSAGLEKIIQKF